MTDRPIRAILDASAIVRFVYGGESALGVGEIIAEIFDEDCMFGVPTPCLAQAWRSTAGGPDPDRFAMLLVHEACRVLAGPEDWRAVAAAMELVDRYDVAVAAVLTIDYDVHLLSSVPGLYTKFWGADFVIEV